MAVKTDYSLMEVKSIANAARQHSEILSHSAILSTFIKLPFAVKSFVLSISVADFDRFYCIFKYSFGEVYRRVYGVEDVVDHGL